MSSPTDMRSLINLMEEVGLKGNLDVRSLIKLLPEVTEPQRFLTAFQKVKRGQEDRLTRHELLQFALAFISLLKEGREEKFKIIRKLSMISAPEAGEPGL
jgi:hypothetical protein